MEPIMRRKIKCTLMDGRKQFFTRAQLHYAAFTVRFPRFNPPLDYQSLQGEKKEA